ncbi:MAG TPA: NAD(P)/FAD-dependent oxidoreductase [Acidobacteriaceae bacterium]
MKRANIVGAGPNGLAAAITLARAGFQVEVFEAEAQAGGGARTMELTLPGFRHDFGSAVHPMAVGSPFFRELPLKQFGLHWIHGDAAVAHPLDDGTAVMLEHKFHEAEMEFGVDGDAWRRLVHPTVEHWRFFAEDGLQPPLRLPRHPFLMARFAYLGLQPATRLVRHFRQERTRALFGGLAAHSMVRFDRPLSAAVALVLGAAAHSGGWPIPRGGAQAIPDAMIRYLERLGGKVHTSRRIGSLDELDGELTMCDVSPRQLLAMAGDQLTKAYRKTLQRFEHGPSAFKVDYALSEPIPWRAKACRRAITVHVGGTFEEIAQAEDVVCRGGHAERPFVLLAQPTLFDPSRAPEGKHVAWVYCHVPNGSTEDMTGRIEAQIERFAPGFRDCVLARNVSSPARLQAMDENLRGGDISGGSNTLRQFVWRPGARSYATGTKGLYLCSASTPPGGGVHGMCGYNAALMAVRKIERG